MRFLSCVFVCRFELGVGLYLGWGASCLSVLGGGLLCSACKRASPAGHKRYGTNTHCELTEGKWAFLDSGARLEGFAN